MFHQWDFLKKNSVKKHNGVMEQGSGTMYFLMESDPNNFLYIKFRTYWYRKAYSLLK